MEPAPLAAAARDPEAFVRTQTQILTPPLIPEIPLHLASEVIALWQMTEAELEATGLPPPFWAFAWAGGQGLARHILDAPETVRGKRVLDFGAGSGLVAIAAMMAGAREAVAADIDPFAAAAMRLNAKLNGVEIAVTTQDLIGTDAGWDVVLCGDVCYEKPLADRLLAWLTDLAHRGADVLIGDPGRTYLPRAHLVEVTAYAVQTSRELEDTDVRNARVYRLAPRAGSSSA